MITSKIAEDLENQLEDQAIDSDETDIEDFTPEDLAGCYWKILPVNKYVYYLKLNDSKISNKNDR